MPRVMHFEIHADQPERAIRFYSTLFGWQFQKWEGPAEYWVIVTGPEGTPGINGGLVRRRGPATGDAVIAYVCTIGVGSLDDTLRTAGTLGAPVVVPKMAVPGVGWLAYCKDTEGNIFGVIQPDTNAR